MNRLASILTAAATTATLFAMTTTASFAANGAAYRLVPATAVTAANTVVVNETLWKCAAGACTAANATSRPAIVCAQAAKKVGKIEAFTANGKEFGAEDLAKCNEKAR
jgi:hypothetical protein